MKYVHTFVFIYIFLFSFTWGQTCDDVVITTTAIDGNIVKTIFIGEGSDSEIIFILTDQGSVYESINLGVSWTNINSRLSDFYSEYFSTNAGTTAKYGVHDIVEGLDNILFFQGYGQNMWVSSNNGTSFTYTNLPLLFCNIEAHPVNPTWLLATGETIACVDGYSSMETEEDCRNALYYSSDLGNTWTLVKDYVLSWGFTWGNAGKLGVPETAVYTIHYDTTSGDIRKMGTNNLKYGYSDNLYYTDEDVTLIDNALGVIVDSTTGYVYIATYNSGKFVLHVSSDNGKTFEDIKFPGNVNPFFITSYYIVDSSEGAMLFGVQYRRASIIAPILDLYLSDENDKEFDLVLENIVVNANGPELHQHGELPGLFISNVWNKFEEKWVKSTVMTYNHGLQWYDLPKPTDNHINPSSTCVGHDCDRMNLYFDDVPQSMHTGGAKGVIVATGQVGRYISPLGTKAVVISEDAGITWKQIRQGSHMTSNTASGAVIFLIPRFAEATNEYLFSFNHGSTFTSCTFGHAGRIEEIFTDNLATGTSFFVEVEDGDGVVELIHFEFSSFFEGKTCSYPEDYETFVPTSPQHETCLLGKTTEYLRRKPDSVCLPVLEHYTEESTICECTLNDYVCGYCYKRDPFELENAKEYRGCYWACAEVDNPNTEPEGGCNTTYTASESFYVLGAGSQCSNPLDLTLDENRQLTCSTPLSEDEIVNEAYQLILEQSNVVFGVLCVISVIVLIILILVSFFYYHKGGHDLSHDA